MGLTFLPICTLVNFVLCKHILLVAYRPMAEDTLTNRPLYNHVLSAEACLSEESSIFQMDMSTVTIPMLEVCISIGNISHNCYVMDSKETKFITRQLCNNITT